MSYLRTGELIYLNSERFIENSYLGTPMDQTETEVLFNCDPTVLIDWDPVKPELSETTVYNKTGLYRELAGGAPTTFNMHNIIQNGNSNAVPRDNGQTSTKLQ